jgi:copper resistance protein B
LLTQKLILSPQIELNLYGRDDPERRIGSGLSDLDAGLRLRYQVTRKFAPFLGLTEQAAFGETARLIRAAGDRPEALRLAVGVRAWF